MPEKGNSYSPFLPDFCRDNTLLLVILMAELLALILSLSHIGSLTSFWRNLALTSLFIQWIALSSITVLCRLGARLNRLRPAASALIAYALVMLITLAISGLTALFLEWVSGQQFVDYAQKLHFMLRNTLISAIVTAVSLRYMYVQHEWKRNIEARTGAQLAALQARIRPHFLFNSMNSIAALIRNQPLAAESAVLDLATVFRSVLVEKDWSTLKDELELTKHYLALEALRLGDRLNVTWQIDPDLDNARLPALTLQPLVENAVYHGIQPRPEGGTILINALNKSPRLLIQIENPLPVTQIHSHDGNGMAINNLKERLSLAFPGESKFEITQDARHFCVTLSLPLALENKNARNDSG